jgi:hypothetical protein
MKPDTESKFRSTGPETLTRRERRRTRLGGAAADPRELVQQSIVGAVADLGEAREALKSARRRVVQLEEVVDFWQAIAATVDESRVDTCAAS